MSDCSFFFADKPSIPLGPLKVEEVRADHVKVKWDKPEDNGGSEITGYVLEKMDLDTGRWIPAGEVGPNEKTFTFSGLTPKKKYKFRVKAVNKEGESEPLEVEEAIVAKNPYGKNHDKSTFQPSRHIHMLSRRAHFVRPGSDRNNNFSLILYFLMYVKSCR